MLSKDKHSSLFQKFVNYDLKKIYCIVIRSRPFRAEPQDGAGVRSNADIDHNDQGRLKKNFIDLPFPE
jgi:hypothetical protein